MYIFNIYEHVLYKRPLKDMLPGFMSITSYTTSHLSRTEVAPQAVAIERVCDGSEVGFYTELQNL